MAKAFYAKLAGANLIHNRRMYGPYCVATALMSGMVFIILNLVLNRDIANLSYGGTVQIMFTIGIVVMALFTVSYMLYINSFLIKRRKKEFGLYAVLGMEKRHVARVILWENGMVSFGSLLLGLLGGAVFGRLAFMLLMRMLDVARGSRFTLSMPALLLTVLIFGGIFVVTTVYNLAQVHLSSPVDLLKGGQKGEKKVRHAGLITVFGLLFLGAAYYLAITVDVPAAALLWFWPAVILVIVATLMLFTGGSVTILGMLQRNPRIYYRPRNFIAISGLIHRMKQNAAGLANICILSTMVVVTVSCCSALYMGQDFILRRQNPNDVKFTFRMEDAKDQEAALDATIADAEELAARHGVALENIMSFHSAEQSLLYVDGKLVYRDEEGNLPYSIDTAIENYVNVIIVPLDDFNLVTGRHETLLSDEFFALTSNANFHQNELPIDGKMMTIKANLKSTPFTMGKNSERENDLYIVVANQTEAHRLVHAMDPTEFQARWTTCLRLDLDADQEAGFAFSEALRERFRARMDAEEAIGRTVRYNTTSIYENRMDGYSLYGGLLFLGIFFAMLFLINTVLILYFKQISEGFDDSERFAILQKVGLSDEEVRATINRQMLIVFLLPLAVTMLHILAASNMIRQMLGTFMLTDFRVTMISILVTSLVFIAVYIICYRQTARTYYRLVRW
ncbi:FtsX-like permease family protein [Eubacteriales bacterium OttesenSCG-928-A19]|nr:FtsX-like permease family protein [Eubacteriales bacterium OttesenSCG-928-A19]